MTTYTPFLKLSKPPFNDIPWDAAVNGNMDIIDTFLQRYMFMPNYVGVWANGTAYVAGQNAFDALSAVIYLCQVTHTSAATPTTFEQDRAANPTYWSEVGSVIPTSMGDVGRNLFHNPLFRVNQRGNGPFSTPGYTLDRWATFFGGGTINVQRINLADSDRTQIGDEAAEYGVSFNYAGGFAPGNYTSLTQNMEHVRRTAGKPVTISFYARAASGTAPVLIQASNIYGTGGSPSATDFSNFVVVDVGSASWQRYTATVIMPSAQGKTFGTNGDDYASFSLYGSHASAPIGPQSNTLFLWGIQVEINTIVTPLEKPDLQYDVSNCLRFFQQGLFAFFGYGVAGQNVGGAVQFTQWMRTIPGISWASTSYVNCAGPTVAQEGRNCFLGLVTVTATGGFAVNNYYYATADL